MQKEIKIVDKERGILRCTLADERWYIREMTDPETGLPKHEFVPSVTWICDSYPKGVSFYRWLASKGWDESVAIKTAAGDKGSKVHYAIRDLIEGKTVPIDAKYKNNSTGEDGELSFEEYDAILSFARWCEEAKPKFLAWEFTVWGSGYAGTVDLLCEIDGQKYLVDFKTSQHIWASHELQVSAYKHALDDQENVKLAILQVGFKLNKKKYKFSEVDDQFNEFLATKTLWAKEQRGIEPKQIEYPLKIKLDIKKEKGENCETTEKRQDGIRAHPKIR